MKYCKLSRRMFLQGLGGSVLPIPFLASLLPRNTWAQVSLPKRYYISMISNYDLGHQKNWVPTLGQPSQVYRGTEGHDIHHAPLSSYINNIGTDHLSYIFRNELNPYLSKMNILMGLDSPLYGGHNNSHILGNALGRKSGGALIPSQMELYMTPTIDQQIAADPNLNPGRGPSIVMGSANFEARGSASYILSPSGEVTEANVLGSRPQDVFSKVFPKMIPDATNPNKYAKESQMLNNVIGDFRNIRNSRAISSTDRVAIDNIMDLYSDITRSMSRIPPANCAFSSLDVAEATHQNYIKVLAAAIQCDLARTAVYTFRMPEIMPAGVTNFHQSISHQPFTNYNGTLGYQVMGNNQHEFIRQVVRPLCDTLSSLVDPSNGKSYLDNSLVHVSCQNGNVHSHYSVPTLLIGGLNGAMSTGNYIDYRNHSKPGYTSQQFSSDPADGDRYTGLHPGVHYNRLLYTIAQKIGLSGVSKPQHSSHLRNISDGSYGAINDGITGSVGGYGSPVPPLHAFTSNWSGSRAGQALQNYDLRRYNSVLPLI